MVMRRGGRGVLKPKKREQNALYVIRESAEFHGVGVYTVSEIFHLAGMSSFPSQLLVAGDSYDLP